MWIITFALLTAYGVLSAATDICDKGLDVCFTPRIPPIEFPESIEELDKICPIVTTRFSCLVDYQIKCGTENPGTIDDSLAKVNEVISDACDKDSDLHQELSISLPCLEKVIRNHVNSCRSISQDAMDAVRSRILLETAESGSADDAEDSMKYYCLYEALDFACLVANSGVMCGSETKELVGRIVDKIGYLDQICDADIREEVKEMVAVIQLEIEEKLALNKIFSKS